jgi:hypothetical protein
MRIINKNRENKMEIENRGTIISNGGNNMQLLIGYLINLPIILKKAINRL